MNSRIFAFGIFLIFCSSAWAQQPLSKNAALEVSNAALTSEGDWEDDTTYAIDDIVTARGSAWISLQNQNKGHLPGQTNPSSDAWWGVFAQGLHFAGKWSSSSVYQPNDLVFDQLGSTWRAKLTNTGKSPADGANWEIVAKAGAQGKQGGQGPRGFQGLPGIRGPVGQAGPPGAQGARGARGQTGDKGDPGEKGDQGEKGDTGPAGTAKALKPSQNVQATADTPRTSPAFGAATLKRIMVPYAGAVRVTFTMAPQSGASSDPPECWVATAVDSTDDLRGNSTRSVNLRTAAGDVVQLSCHSGSKPIDDDGNTVPLRVTVSNMTVSYDVINADGQPLVLKD